MTSGVAPVIPGEPALALAPVPEPDRNNRPDFDEIFEPMDEDVLEWIDNSGTMLVPGST